MKDSNIAGNLSKDLVSEEKMGEKYVDADLFPADKLLSKMGDNLARAERGVNDEPLWTPKTAELEKNEDNN